MPEVRQTLIFKAWLENLNDPKGATIIAKGIVRLQAFPGTANRLGIEFRNSKSTPDQATASTSRAAEI